MERKAHTPIFQRIEKMENCSCQVFNFTPLGLVGSPSSVFLSLKEVAYLLISAKRNFSMPLFYIFSVELSHAEWLNLPSAVH